MLDRINPVLRLICLGFAALMFFQVSRLAIWKSPLADVVIPNVVSAPTNNVPTNSASTNVVSTNVAAKKGTNTALANVIPTNAVSTNVMSKNGATTNTTSTNGILAKGAPTNTVSTNAASARRMDLASANPPPGSSRRNMNLGMNPGMRGPGMPDMSLPSVIQGRVDRVIQSEILGMIMRPPPMALLGIAGKDILFRAPNGQTGLLREGEELGGVKLLQIRPNRVLIEQDGQKKELTMFEGIGSESLLPK